MAKTKDKVEEAKEVQKTQEAKETKEEKKVEKKAKKETLQVETREDVKTYFFPPEAVKLTKIDNKFGYLVSGYEKNGYDVKVFIPQKDGDIDSKQLKHSKKLPYWVVASMPKDAKLTGYIMVDVQQKKDEEKDERALDDYEIHDTKQYDKIDNRKVDRFTNKKLFFEGRPEREDDGEYVQDLYNDMYGKKQRRQEYCTIGTAVLDKLEKKYAKYRNNTEEKSKEEPQKDAEVKETDKVVSDGKEATTEASAEAGKTADKGEKPIFITSVAKELKSLRNGKGFFLDFKHLDEDLSIFIPTKAEGVSAQRKSSWIMIKADKDYKFYLYRPDGKGNYEKTDFNVGVDLVRHRSWKINQAYEKNNDKSNDKSNDKKDVNDIVR